MRKIQDLFDLSGRVAVLAGDAGLLGTQAADALAEAGAHAVIADKRLDLANAKATELSGLRE